MVGLVQLGGNIIEDFTARLVPLVFQASRALWDCVRRAIWLSCVVVVKLVFLIVLLWIASYLDMQATHPTYHVHCCSAS